MSNLNEAEDYKILSFETDAKIPEGIDVNNNIIKFDDNNKIVEHKATIKVKGPAVVTAGMIETSSNVEVMNKDAEICTLDNGATLDMEITLLLHMAMEYKQHMDIVIHYQLAKDNMCLKVNK